MEHRTDAKFGKLLDALPKAIQTKANRQLQRLEENHRHPSLHFKKVPKKENLWSFRVDGNYRALGYEDEAEITWYWVGTHSDMDKILNKK